MLYYKEISILDLKIEKIKNIKQLEYFMIVMDKQLQRYIER